MLRTVLALLAVTSGVPALAQSRPDSATMTCRAAAGLVRQQGALVLGTGPLIYERYVSDRGFCDPTQRTKQAFVKTRDEPACLVGFTCFEAENHDPPSN